MLIEIADLAPWRYSSSAKIRIRISEDSSHAPCFSLGSALAQNLRLPATTARPSRPAAKIKRVPGSGVAVALLQTPSWLDEIWLPKGLLILSVVMFRSVGSNDAISRLKGLPLGGGSAMSGK